jgi:mannose-6-phosphate isomerase-like protein (cupin superfamily)
MKTRYSDIPAFITKDGSTIRELMHPGHHGNRHQSLAEATVPPGGKTQLHRHIQTEEIYHITRGTGAMTLGDECINVRAGDSILIPPGTPHCIENAGENDLVILCCCAPAYSDEDTELLSIP